MPKPPDPDGVTSLGELQQYLRDGGSDALATVLENWGSLSVRLAMLANAVEDRLAEVRPRNYPPLVFVAYKWESDAHHAWVRRLAEHLRGRGWAVMLDQDHLERDASNFSDVPAYIARLVDCDRFLAVVTERYLDLVEMRQNQTSWVFDEYELASRLHMHGALRIQAVWKEAEVPPQNLLLRLDAVDMRHEPDRFEAVDGLFPVYEGPTLDVEERQSLTEFMRRFDGQLDTDEPDVEALLETLVQARAFEALYDYRLRLARLYWRTGAIDQAYEVAMSLRDVCDDDEDTMLLAQIFDAAGDHSTLFRFLHLARSRHLLRDSVIYHYFAAETLRERNSVFASLNHFRWLCRSPAFARLPTAMSEGITETIRELSAQLEGLDPEERFRCTACEASYINLGALNRLCGDCGTLYESTDDRCPVCANDGLVPLGLLLPGVGAVPVGVECPICNEGELVHVV